MNAFKLLFTGFVISTLLISCEKNNSSPNNNGNITFTNLSFTDCISLTKSDDTDLPSISLKYKEGDLLELTAINTEFCCGTDSISLNNNIDGSKINITVFDEEPYSNCICLHDISITIGSLDQIEYTLTFIESENAYSRDTFEIKFMFNESLDTTITKGNSQNQLTFTEVDLGGCNDMDFKSAELFEDEPDTIKFTIDETDLNIFVGLNLTCCIEFETNSFISGDTIIMQINTLNDEVCNCMCYYTFDYSYSNYNNQPFFFYKFYIDDFLKLEGKYPE